MATLRLLVWRLVAAPWRGFPRPYADQWARRRAIAVLVAAFRPDAIVETGTFLGLTTRALARFGVPVYSVEVNPAFFHLARVNLSRAGNVTTILGDSVEVLRRLASRRTIARPLAYLDAHWESVLPLREEVRCLLGHWHEIVVVIDDARVPDDEGYRFDVYDGRAISIELVDPGETVLAAYPAVAGRDEGGQQCGTLYLAQGIQARAAIEQAIAAGLLRGAAAPA